MGQVALASKHRTKVGKNSCSKLRFAGRIPGVLYGPSIKPVHLDIEEKEVSVLVHTHGLNPIINLTIEGSAESSCLCMIKEVQQDVFHREILHIDLRKVDLNEKIEVTVPLTLHGEAAIRLKGGVVEQMVRGIRVLSLPTNIPEQLTADISELRIGHTITVSAIVLPEGVELAPTQDRDAGVVNVFTTRGTVLQTESESASAPTT